MLTLVGAQTLSLILHLPDQPAGRDDATHPQALGRVATVAVAHRIHQGLLQAQLQVRRRGALAEGPQSTFTTVTVNRNFQTATHKDAGDLHAGFGVMSCLRNYKYDGAYLVFPAYRVAVNFAHGCLCLADVHEWHSNTSFTQVRVGYERITLVFYYREKMVNCKPAHEEVAWAKNRKRGEALS